MQLITDGVIAALAALGAVTLLWALITGLRRPCQTDAAVLVPCRGDGAALEQTVHALERARCEYGGFRRIVILDCGLDADARRVASLLCREAYDVTYHRAGDGSYEWE